MKEAKISIFYEKSPCRWRITRKPQEGTSFIILRRRAICMYHRKINKENDERYKNSGKH